MDQRGCAGAGTAASAIVMGCLDCVPAGREKASLGGAVGRDCETSVARAGDRLSVCGRLPWLLPLTISELGGAAWPRGLALLALADSRERSDPCSMRDWAGLGAGSLVCREEVGADPVAVTGAASALVAERSDRRPEPPPLAGGVAGLPAGARGDWTGATRGAAGVGAETWLPPGWRTPGGVCPPGFGCVPVA